jgi:hypothetical protein
MQRHPQYTPPSSSPLSRAQAAVGGSGEAPYDESLPYGTRSSVSTPLADARIYGPGSVLALAILMLPVVLAVGLALGALQFTHTVPPWIPVLSLVWLPALPLLWEAMKSVRTSAIGVAVGRPWRTWIELRWDEIQHVEQRGMSLYISSRSPAAPRLKFAPRLLIDGARLRREILLRLPPTVLSVRLSRDAEALLRAGDFAISPEGSLEGMVQARTRARYWALPLIAAIAAILVGAALVVILATPLIWIAAAACAIVAIFSLCAALWLPQQFTLDADGFTVVRVVWPARQRQRTFRWQRMDMVEYTPRRALLRIRGQQERSVCAGPLLLPRDQSTIVWHFVQSRCQEHGVPLVMRRRLP